MSENDDIQETFNEADQKLMQALARLDGVIGSTLENYSSLKKELAKKQAKEEPLLSNSEIKSLQNENGKLLKENEEFRLSLTAERAKYEKLVKVKADVSERIDNLIERLEKVA